MLLRACQIAGHNITLSDAWRSYAEQKYYWDAYMAGWGNIASNPDSGQRNHMRGAAFDITYTTQQNRNAMLQAGFTPDPDESWHFNNPNWPNMPIIPTDDSPAGTPIVVTAHGGEREMYLRATSNSRDGHIAQGWTYKQFGNGPFVPLTNLESVAFFASGTFYAEYNGDDILLLTAIYGLAEYETLPSPNTIWGGKELTGPGKLTGRIIYPDDPNRVFPTVQAAAGK
jgi:hypothetical protein